MTQLRKALNVTFIFAASASLSLHAQAPQPYQGIVGRTLAESKEWWPEPVKAPAAAPIVIWILLDDVGFGAPSAFGGLIATPTFDNLANNGLRYTNFHTTAICAPTRSALLTVSGISDRVMSTGWKGRLPSSGRDYRRADGSLYILIQRETPEKAPRIGFLRHLANLLEQWPET